jgi:hypothetical protein
MAYVYRHIRLDKNEPFYIGIGNNDYRRSMSKRSRNAMWNNIVTKTDYEVEIMLDGLTWDEACEKEKEFIAIYGRRDLKTGILCNMTDGGEGTIGRKISDINRINLINRNIGNNYGKLTKGIKRTEEQKQKLKGLWSGSKHPLYGTNRSIEVKNKIAISKNCLPFVVYKDNEIIGKYLLQSECAKELKINKSAINMCLNGKREQTAGYKFKLEKLIKCH